MAPIITGFFDDDEAAKKAVCDLEEASIPIGDISVTSGNADKRWNSSFLPAADGSARAAGTGAAIGGVMGGAGLLAGLGMLTLPGLGPVVAAGWLATALAGAAAGVWWAR